MCASTLLGVEVSFTLTHSPILWQMRLTKGEQSLEGPAVSLHRGRLLGGGHLINLALREALTPYFICGSQC